MKEKIIHGCLPLFLKYGVKSISVDDICNSLGISKKTFYQHFTNKDSIIKGVASEFISKSEIFLNQILLENNDVIEKLVKIYKETLKHFSSCNPRFIYDLRKYYSEIFTLFLNYNDNQFYSAVIKLLKQGKEQGYFRKDIDEEITFKFFQNRVSSIIDGSLLPGKSISDPVFLDSIITGFVGITTIEGHQKLELKLKDFRK